MFHHWAVPQAPHFSISAHSPDDSVEILLKNLIKKLPQTLRSLRLSGPSAHERMGCQYFIVPPLMQGLSFLPLDLVYF